MNLEFRITYEWIKRDVPGTFLEIVDASKIANSLDYFLTIYQGYFTLNIQGYELHFDLDPDLSTIFEMIPNALITLTKNTDQPVELDFFEQGSDIGILMQRLDDQIIISFDTAPASGTRFKFLPDVPLAVPADQFYRQWLHFTRAILNSLTEMNPELANDESCQKYFSQLTYLESQI